MAVVQTISTEHAKAWAGGRGFIPAALTGAAITGDVLTAHPLSNFQTETRCNAVNETNGNGNGNGAKLNRLLERQKEIEAQLAEEKLRLAKRKQKDNKKLYALVGGAVCDAAERSPDFHLMLKQTLGGAVTDAAAGRFLDARGYIA